MATAPGATGNWVWNGNEFVPAVQTYNEGQLNWAPTEGYSSGNLLSQNYAGTRDQIYQSLFGRTPESIQSQFGINPDQYITQAMQGVTPYTEGSGTAHIGSKPLLSMLDAAGVDWRSNPNLVNYDQQATAQAMQQAQQTDAINSAGMTPQQLAMMAATVWGGGYLMGTGLGAAQGLGGFGELLANPSLTGANLGGAGAADAAWGVTQGTGGMDWYDSLSNLIDTSGQAGWSTNPSFSDLGGVWGSDFAGGGGGGMDWYDSLSNLIDTSGQSGWSTNPSFQDLGGFYNSGQGGWLDTLSKLKLPSMPGGGGGQGGGNGQAGWGVNQALGGALGGLLGGGGDLLGKGLATAPVLAALNYAYNNTGFDTGRLEDLYGAYNPQAMAYQYDQNTMAGRDALTSGLARRGITGSSFANMDLTNYNTNRDLGRAALISSAVPTAGGLAGQILGANIAEQKLKNDLIGSGVSAIGQIFGGGGSPQRYGAMPGAMPTGGGGGGNWWDSIAGMVGGGRGGSVATPPYFPNPLDIWNV